MAAQIKPYLAALLQKKLREEGRGLNDYRKIEVEINPLASSAGSARVKIGSTEVLVGVKLDVGEPFPDTPNEGVLIGNAELVPMASPDFEPGPPKPESIEIARVIDRGIRESHAIDMQKMVIKEGEKVWMVNFDVYPINHDGNLLDAGALGAIIALMNARFPKYDEKAGRVKYTELTKEKLPMTEIPIMTTFGKLSGTIFVDPTKREGDVMDTRLSITTLESEKASSMQKGGFGTFTKDDVLQMFDLAVEKGKELRKLLKQATSKA
ncbi:MAG: exosome complex protein Rrp42 [DPANN group archaeon]|nr:exosome complex protein Rrp42 [DPANN group archaeon]